MKSIEMNYHKIVYFKLCYNKERFAIKTSKKKAFNKIVGRQTICHTSTDAETQ